jgi:hypothetical protein
MNGLEPEFELNRLDVQKAEQCMPRFRRGML